MSPVFAGCHMPVDRRQRMGESAAVRGESFPALTDAVGLVEEVVAVTQRLPRTALR